VFHTTSYSSIKANANDTFHDSPHGACSDLATRQEHQNAVPIARRRTHESFCRGAKRTLPQVQMNGFPPRANLAPAHL
jgi:hypothetical protein